jgi:ABC-type bacteriocin/lantibiotic exporter with double-glycine peptidase domain
MGYISKIKFVLIITIACMVVEAFSYLGAITLQQYLIDEVLLNNKQELFWIIFSSIAAAYVIHSIFITVSSVYMYKSATRMRLNMTRDFVLRLHRMPLEKLKNERTAKYIYQFATDVGDIGSVCNMVAGDLTRIVKQFIALIALLYILRESPLLVLLLVTVSLLYVVIGRLLSSHIKAVSGKVNSTRADMLVQLEEGVASSREVVAFHREKWEMDHYLASFGRYFTQVLREGTIVNKQLISSHLLKWSASFVVLGVGGYLVLNGQLSVGLLVISYQLVSEMMDITNELYERIMKIPGYMASSERLRQVYEAEQPSMNGASLQSSVHELRVDRVFFSFQGRENDVLRGASLQIPLGGKIAFVGSSGSGKSTLAGLLMRFYEPREGSLIVNGRPLTEWSREDWMKRVAIVFQEPYFFPDTIRTNLIMGFDCVTEEAMIEACRVAQIHDFIDSLPDRYDTITGERGVMLSGGQRQRLALARALIRNPEILILDEATSALDVETERRLQESLDVTRTGKTTIVIAHRLSTIRNSERIFVLHQGEVVEQGTYSELMRINGVYRYLEATPGQQNVENDYILASNS